MSHVQHLPLYSAACIYLREIYRVRATLPKILKYDLGQEIFSSATQILKCVVIANRAQKKEDFIQKLLLEIEVQWVFLRILFDLRGITQGEFKVLSERLSEIGRQSEAWLKWQKSSQHRGTSKSVQKELGNSGGMA